MKQLLLATIILILPNFFGPNLNEIKEAIGSGSVTKLSSYFDENIEITLFGKRGVYSKSQAVQLLNNFFQDFQAAGFRQVHEGTSKGGDSQFCIGNLKTQSKTFRVYIFMRVEANRSFIKELRFNEE